MTDNNFIFNNCINEIQDKKISKAIVLQFCMLITNYTVKHLFQIHDAKIRAIISLVFIIVVGLIFLNSFPIVWNRGKSVILKILYYCINIFVLMGLIYTKNSKYMFEIVFTFFFMIIPCFIYYACIFDKSIFLNTLNESAYYQIVVSIIFFMTRKIALEEYDMVYSYLTLVPVVLLLYKLFNNFKFIDFFLFSLGVISIVGMGSRGPLLAIINFALFYPLISIIKVKDVKYSYKLMFFIILILFLLMMTILNLEYLLNIISAIFVKFNLNSRTLSIVLNYKNVDLLAGRYEIYTNIVKYIKENPFWGYGIGGDRVLLNGTYCHNIFLEILIDFGIIFGILIIVFLVIISINGLFNKNKTKRDLALIFFSIGVVQLFISGSYLTSVNFWIYIAICINPANKFIYNDKSVKTLSER